MQNFPQKMSWGLTHSPTSEFFSDLYIFLTWQNPLATGNQTSFNLCPARPVYIQEKNVTEINPCVAGNVYVRFEA